jgi:hypothetical protein
MTSSVTRSTPWSYSQSRVNAERSKVAGSMSCRATAMSFAERLIAFGRTPPLPRPPRSSARPN